MVTSLHENVYQLGSFTWNAIDNDGVSWFLTRDDDWWRSTTRRLTYLDRPFANGSGRTRSWAGPRSMTFEGYLCAPTRALRDVRADQFAALCGDGGTVPLIGPGIDGQYQLDVEYSDPPDIVNVNSREFTFQLQLVAPDPLKRSVIQYTTGQMELPSTSGGMTFPTTYPVTFTATVTSGSALVTNGGVTDVGMLLRVDGPAANPHITLARGTDVRNIRIGFVIETGQWLTIDTAARTVMLNDSVSRRGLTSFEGDFTLAPGTSEISWDADVFNTTARLTATWRYARY